ncbi:MAG TPA: efflux RND transporter periplasmic adaptor subunit, partial [Gammaproteobacteria bacterium]
MKLLIFSAGVFFVVFDLLPSYAAESHDAHDHKKEATEQASHPGYDPGVDKEKDIHKDEHGHDDKNPSSGSQAHDTHGHDDKEHREQETRTEGKVLLTNEKQRIAGIAVIELQQQSIQQEIILPGEVKANSYATSIVSPRIHAQISQRHARLGQSINKGRPLATLSSVEMAQAQGELIIANREWSRVMKLGSNVVAEKRFLEAQIAQQQAMAKVLAYGMTEKQLDNLLEKGDLAGATGRFDLLAPQNGTVIKDDFVIG